MSPEKVDECVESVLESNPSYSEDRAYAICQAQANEGNLSLPDDPTHDDLLQAQAAENGECPEGQVHTGEACVPVEDVTDVPPSSFDMSAPRVLAARELAGAIERVEQSDGTVRYKSIKLLSEGVWTDQNSKQPTHYDPRNLEVSPDNSVNIAHDDDNDVSEVGHIDAESAYVEDGDLYADIVLHMDNAASEYADENLQKTLETGGAKGFGGPSVEIPPEGLEIEQHGELGYPKTEAGVINGLGLVKNPASRPTSFDVQTAQRQVALSGGQTDKALLLKQADMTDPYKLLAEHGEEIAKALQDMATVASLVESAEAEGFDSSEQTVSDLIAFVNEEMDADDGALQAVQDAADAFLETVEADSLDAVSAEAMRDWVAEQDGAEMEDDEDEDEDEDDEGMENEAAEALQSEIDDLRDELEAIKSDMVAESEMSEELEDAKDELAAAETVAELQDAKDELDKRLSEVEDQEMPAKTLGEGAGEDAAGFDWSDPNDQPAQYDPSTGSTY